MNEKDVWTSVSKDFPQGRITLGPYFSETLLVDPKHLTFTFSRYKFVMKMLPKDCSLLELGCNEGLGSLVYGEKVRSFVGVDLDQGAIEWAREAHSGDPRFSFVAENCIGGSYGKFDAVVSLDVIEHILPENESPFMETILSNLSESGMVIVGTPNITASAFASEGSRIGHINLYDGNRLRALFEREFHNVFLFGMNDEVVHTGFTPMSHYLLILACNPKRFRA